MAKKFENYLQNQNSFLLLHSQSRRERSSFKKATLAQMVEQLICNQ